jgi:hypothetical protein
MSWCRCYRNIYPSSLTQGQLSSWTVPNNPFQLYLLIRLPLAWPCLQIGQGPLSWNFYGQKAIAFAIVSHFLLSLTNTLALYVKELISAVISFMLQAGNTKGGSITVPLTSCLTGLDLSVLQIKTKIVSCQTADSKPVKQEVNSTVILPPLVFPGQTNTPAYSSSYSHIN